jgi:FkbM family methyltransferase
MVVDCAYGPLFFRNECPRTLIHVGANSGQEFELYKHAGVDKAVYVEPSKEAFLLLQQRLSKARPRNVHVAVQAICMSESGKQVQLNISNRAGVASSTLGLGRVRQLHPRIEYVGVEEMHTTTVDAIVDDAFSGIPPELMVVDTQGTELEVLKGAERSLGGGTRFVFCEVSDEPLYEGGCNRALLESFLARFDFRLIYLLLNSRGWGEALYARDGGRAS